MSRRRTSLERNRRAPYRRSSKRDAIGRGAVPHDAGGRASDSAEVLNGHALYAHASLRRQHDLIGKLAIESAVAVLSFAPCHMRSLPFEIVGTSPKVFKMTASLNSPTFGSPPCKKAIARRYMASRASEGGATSVGHSTGGPDARHDPSARRALQRRRSSRTFRYEVHPCAFENETGTRVKSLLRWKMPRERGSHGITNGSGEESRRVTSPPDVSIAESCY
jgi:hypothetical protein